MNEMPPKRKDQSWKQMAQMYHMLWQSADRDAKKWKTLVELLKEDVKPDYYHCES